MSKAILVIDMPKNCLHCKLQDWANCRIVKGCHTGDSRPDWCPLKLVPCKRLGNYSLNVAIENDCFDGTEEDLAWFAGKDRGWNNCIDEILKGE